jgi:ABC-type Fe3+/spermidine/putrescine transport system ATPase subunit
LETVDAGTILWNQEPIEGPDQKLVPGHEHIKLVHQDFGLMPRHTVKENISYVVRHLPGEEQEKVTDDFLHRFYLHQEAHRWPEHLSGGQQQRVALARALAQEPEILLLDEPFSQLDTLLKTEILEQLVAWVRESGTTLVLVTHDAREALVFADQMLVLKSGKVVQIGRPQDIYLRPTEPYVGALLGRINLLSPSQLSLFGISWPTLAGIRAEHVAEDPQGPSFTISAKGFYGEKTLYTAQYNDLRIHFYGPHQRWALGSTVRLGFLHNDLLAFP